MRTILVQVMLVMMLLQRKCHHWRVMTMPQEWKKWIEDNKTTVFGTHSTYSCLVFPVCDHRIFITKIMHISIYIFSKKLTILIRISFLHVSQLIWIILSIGFYQLDLQLQSVQISANFFQWGGWEWCILTIKLWYMCTGLFWLNFITANCLSGNRWIFCSNPVFGRDGEREIAGFDVLFHVTA